MNIFTMHINRNLKKEEFNVFASMIKEEKQVALKKYYFYEDAQRSLLGDVLVRYAVQKCYNLHNNELVFSINEYGKPLLASHPDIQFNISHAGNYVVCAISDSAAVGIDVENIRFMNLNIAKHFFSQDEYEYLVGQPVELQMRCFYSLWTKKESYVKMIGKGFSIPPSSFSVLGSCKAVFKEFIQNDEVVGNVCSWNYDHMFCYQVNYMDIMDIMGIQG